MRCFFYGERVRREMSRVAYALSKRNLCVLNPGAIYPLKGRETLASCDKEMTLTGKEREMEQFLF